MRTIGLGGLKWVDGDIPPVATGGCPALMQHGATRRSAVDSRGIRPAWEVCAPWMGLARRLATYGMMVW